MTRRSALVVLGLLSVSVAAYAQPRKVPRVGLLCSVLCTPAAMQAFHLVLRSHGYVDGQTIELVHRREDHDADRVDVFARELIAKPVDLMLAMDMIPAWVARYHTRTIPIVAGLRDPTVLGRLEHPAPNVCGLSFVWAELAGKRLELLKEAVPTISNVGIIWRGGWWSGGAVVDMYSGLQAGAQALGFKVHRIDVERPDELDGAFSTMARERLDGFIVGPHEWFVVHRTQIAKLALKHRLPGIYELREQAEAGGLLAYGPSPGELFTRAAYQVVKILRGAKPSQVPIEQPAKFELVINLKTAKALGLTIPQSVLLRADEVIE